MDNINAAVLASATAAARRAGYYARNNPWISAAVASLVSNAVGSGIKPRSRHADPKVREALHTLWDRWTNQADGAGLADFYGLQALAVRAMIEGGESFARLRDAGPGAVPLTIELLDREQVPLDHFSDLRLESRVRAGIEFDADGRRCAYHVLTARPGDPFAPLAGLSYQTVRIPGADICHLFQPLAAGQLRGLTWLAPVLLRLHELDQFEDAALVRAKVAALFAGFIRDLDGTAAGQASAGNTLNGILELGMEPGSLIPLPAGADITFSNPAETKDYGPFTKSHIRAIAMGLGVPYENVSGDLEGVTYSSIRAGLVEFRRRIEQLQHNVVVFQFCRPVWERFVRNAVLSGALPVRDFEADSASYLAVDWLPPRFDWVDPLKDARAEIEQINAGLKSRSQSIAERGYDAEDVFRQIATDQRMTADLGIAFAPPVATAAAWPTAPETAP
ncbi:MAG: phage portal protein [Alphaproteobacteria bacterium]